MSSVKQYGMFFCGIYKITNLANGKCYIGSSKTIPYRIYEHKRHLRLGNHCNKHLQSAWNKYGEVNFSFDVLFICQEQDLPPTEISFIEALKSFYKDGGYNMTTGGDGCGISGPRHPMYGIPAWNKGKKMETPWNKGRKSSPETILKMRISKTKLPPVIKMDKNGLELSRYFNSREAAKQNGIAFQNIDSVLKGKGKTAGKYKWKYMNEFR